MGITSVIGKTYGTVELIWEIFGGGDQAFVASPPKYVYGACIEINGIIMGMHTIVWFPVQRH